MRANYLWVNGEFVPHAEAALDFLGASRPNEDLVFEDIRCYDTEAGPAVFRLEEHLVQFLEAIREKGYQVSYPMQELCDTVHRTMAYNGVREGSIRPAVYPVEGGSWGSTTQRPPTVTLAVAAWQPGRDQVKDQISPDHLEAIELISDQLDDIALFIVRAGEIQTQPSRHFGNRVMRDSVLTLAEDLGYPVKKHPLTPDAILTADEVFISEAVGDIRPAAAIDGKQIGNGKPGSVTRALMEAFYETAHGRGRRSAEWLDWVGGSFVGP